jgi:hypothetical protein
MRWWPPNVPLASRPSSALVPPWHTSPTDATVHSFRGADRLATHTPTINGQVAEVDDSSRQATGPLCTVTHGLQSPRSATCALEASESAARGSALLRAWAALAHTIHPDATIQSSGGPTGWRHPMWAPTDKWPRSMTRAHRLPYHLYGTHGLQWWTASTCALVASECAARGSALLRA